MSSWYSSLERAIVERAFVPELRHALTIRRLVDRYDDPAEAWESLFARGFLPTSWASSSSRSFVIYDGLDSWRDCSARFCHTSAHPPSNEGCLHAAAGLVSLITAEHLALEMLRLLGHDDLPERFTWVVAPRPLVIPGEALGFAVLQRAVRVALNDWSEAAYRKRALRDLSKRRREIAKSECHRRSNLQQHALYADEEMSVLDHVLTELVAGAPLADAEYVRVSSATHRASGGTMEIGQPIKRYFGPLRALLELLALGVGVGPVENGTMFLVLKG